MSACRSAARSVELSLLVSMTTYGPGLAAASARGGRAGRVGVGDVLALAGFAAIFLALASASISRRK